MVSEQKHKLKYSKYTETELKQSVLKVIRNKNVHKCKFFDSLLILLKINIFVLKVDIIEIIFIEA